MDRLKYGANRSDDWKVASEQNDRNGVFGCIPHVRGASLEQLIQLCRTCRRELYVIEILDT